jgi:hypothetical protein
MNVGKYVKTERDLRGEMSRSTARPLSGIIHDLARWGQEPRD